MIPLTSGLFQSNSIKKTSEIHETLLVFSLFQNENENELRIMKNEYGLKK